MNNTYGTVRPALINIATDVEVFYQYRPTRNTEDDRYKLFKSLNPTSILEHSEIEGTGDVRLPGMYNIKLPVGIFGNVGFYTIYIRPKEYKTQILDVGVLSSYPDIRGIVVNINSLEGLDASGASLFTGDILNGYRVEYLMADGDTGELMRQEFYRIITGCNRCKKMADSANAYTFSSDSSLAFLTLTPSTSPSYKANQNPFIGGDDCKDIIITNTKFDPIMIEIEITKHDIETLNTAIDGNQIRSLDNGLLTTFNENGEIYSQKEFATIKSTYTSTELYEIKKDVGANIDTTVETNYSEIMNGE